ncbi:MAG: hypothetical protein COA33_009610 [Fluviicola sp.]|nr:hypothetical protein [Fluviicola sp.]
MGSKQNKVLIKQAGIIVSLFCILLFSSCANDKKTVATVGNVALTEDDAVLLLQSKGYNLGDSSQYITIIDEWCEQQAFLQSLKKSNPEKYRLIELRSDAFSSDLARFFIEEQEYKKRLDTIVSEEEILEYYQSNQEEFVLQDYLVKALYLKIPVELDFKSENVNQNFLLKNDKDLAELNSYAKLYAQNYYFNDSTWIYFNEIVKDVPVSKYNVDNIVLNRSKTYFSDDQFTYFINIIDFKLKTEAPPVSFLSNDIKRIIVSHRLQELIEKNESKLIQRIKNEHEINSKL